MKPILFSTPMVRAILEGRKTQTRRPIDKDVSNCFDIDVDGKAIAYINPQTGDSLKPEEVCRYQPGDILWVRETWCRYGNIENPLEGYWYKADGINQPYMSNCKFKHSKWRPSIHMPREAARLFLEVTEVRVERLQEILCSGMVAEGVIPSTVKGGQWQQWQCDYFKPLWDSIYSKRGYGWEQNPWVWVISFERTERPDAR